MGLFPRDANLIGPSWAPASVLLFCHAAQHMASQFPDQRLKLHPLHWKHALNHWTAREVPILIFLASIPDECTIQPGLKTAA